jgi:hypothetical protein
MTDAAATDIRSDLPLRERPWAVRVSYRPRRDEVCLVLDGGASVVVPRTAIDELRDLPRAHMSEITLMSGGHAVAVERDDIHIYVPGLVRDLIGLGTQAVDHAAYGRRNSSKHANRRKAAST